MQTIVHWTKVRHGDVIVSWDKSARWVVVEKSHRHLLVEKLGSGEREELTFPRGSAYTKLILEEAS